MNKDNNKSPSDTKKPLLIGLVATTIASLGLSGYLVSTNNNSLDRTSVVKNLEKDKVSFEKVEQENIVTGISRIKISRKLDNGETIFNFMLVSNDGNYLINDNILNLRDRNPDNSPKLMIKEMLESSVAKNLDGLLLKLNSAEFIEFKIDYSNKADVKKPLKNITVIADINDPKFHSLYNNDLTKLDGIHVKLYFINNLDDGEKKFEKFYELYSKDKNNAIDLLNKYTYEQEFFRNKDLKDKTYNYSLVKVALSSNDINVIPITINTDNKKFSLGTPDLDTLKAQLFEEQK